MDLSFVPILGGSQMSSYKAGLSVFKEVCDGKKEQSTWPGGIRENFPKKVNVQ
jgi:hypothetical protein